MERARVEREIRDASQRAAAETQAAALVHLQAAQAAQAQAYGFPTAEGCPGTGTRPRVWRVRARWRTDAPGFTPLSSPVWSVSPSADPYATGMGAVASMMGRGWVPGWVPGWASVRR